ncbi:MAG: hypothetical protein AB1599_07040 [Planctomycetota bacterium]
MSRKIPHPPLEKGERGILLHHVADDIRIERNAHITTDINEEVLKTPADDGHNYLSDKDKAKIVTGWLMGEKKVCLKQVKGTKYIYLTEDEKKKYHQVKNISLGHENQPRA